MDKLAIGLYATNSLLNTNLKTSVSGQLLGNHGFLSSKQPFLKLSIPVFVKANNYWLEEGVPLNANLLLSNVNGFIICSHVHVDKISRATNAEKSEIETLLKNGVIF